MNSYSKFDGKISKIDEMAPKIKTLGSKKTPVDRLKVKSYLCNRE